MSDLIVISTPGDLEDLSCAYQADKSNLRASKTVPSKNSKIPEPDAPITFSGSILDSNHLKTILADSQSTHILISLGLYDKEETPPSEGPKKLIYAIHIAGIKKTGSMYQLIEGACFNYGDRYPPASIKEIECTRKMTVSTLGIDELTAQMLKDRIRNYMINVHLHRDNQIYYGALIPINEAGSAANHTNLSNLANKDAYVGILLGMKQIDGQLAYMLLATALKKIPKKENAFSVRTISSSICGYEIENMVSFSDIDSILDSYILPPSTRTK